ncbi:MAG TPA: hypothetical protein VLC09_20025 [Polyangiaceae bacterium]|nr:hypothetical protein [Polyangiaceae bacterium]
MSPGFAFLALLPWLTRAFGTGVDPTALPASGDAGWVATLVMGAACAAAVASGYPRRLPAQLVRSESGWMVRPTHATSELPRASRLELIATPPFLHGRCGGFATYAVDERGGRWLVDHSNHPAALIGRARLHAGLPVDVRWGPSDGRTLASRPFVVTGYPWLGRERIRGVQALLCLTLAVAWCLVLGGSVSPVGTISVALAIGSWVVMATVAVMTSLDQVRIDAGERLRVERRRLGFWRREQEFEWSALRELSIAATERGQTFFVVVSRGPSAGGEAAETTWAWPIEPTALGAVLVHSPAGSLLG